MVLQVVAGSLHVQEHGVSPPDVLHVHLARFPLGRQQGAGGDKLDGVPERGGLANLGEELQGFLGHLNVFLLASGLDNLSDFV